jgi:hypothetical protein
MVSADEASTTQQNSTNTNAVVEELNLNASRVATPAPLFEALSEADAALSDEFRLEEVEEAVQSESTVQQERVIFVGFDYRLNLDTWLIEIQRLTEDGNEPELAEERRLFAESYPDINIDSALAELRD